LGQWEAGAAAQAKGELAIAPTETRITGGGVQKNTNSLGKKRAEKKEGEYKRQKKRVRSLPKLGGLKDNRAYKGGIPQARKIGNYSLVP